MKYTISCVYVITCNKTEWCVWNLFWTYALCNFICSFVWCKTSWNFSILYGTSTTFSWIFMVVIMCVDMTYNMKNIYIFAKHFVCRMAYLLYKGAIRNFKIWYFLTFNEVLQHKSTACYTVVFENKMLHNWKSYFLEAFLSSNLKRKKKRIKQYKCNYMARI